MGMTGKLEEYVKDKSTEAEIEAALEQVCSYFPSYKSQCDALVEAYTPQIIQLLVDDVSPKEICTELGLCDALKSKVVPMTELQPSSKPSIKPVEKSLSCDLCHVVVQIVEDKITENATFEAIESHVQEVYKLLPAKVTSQCGKFVDEELHRVVGMVDNKLKFSSLGDSTGCDICKLILEDLEQNLAGNSTEEEIEEFLMQACDVLPDNSQAFCIDIVKEYVPEIIAAFLDQESPSAICKQVGICKQLVGVDKCTFGPSYWCKDMKSAIQCNAVAHCKQHFW